MKIVLTRAREVNGHTFIVEARHDQFASLYAVGDHMMAEVPVALATKFSRDRAREIAVREASKRTGRRLLVINTAK